MPKRQKATMPKRQPLPRKRKLPPTMLRQRIAIKDGDTVRAAPFDGTLEAFLEPWTPGTTSLETEMQPGDELWIWSNVDWDSESLMGRGGYAIVRDGKPVDHLNVWMS